MGWLGVPSPSTHELHLALAYSLSSPVDSCVTWTRACNHLASWLIEAEMGTWLFKVLTISPPCSTTFHGSPLPSRGMQAWHSRLLTRLPHLSQLLLVLSTPQHFWVFRGSAKQLPTSKQPEISFLTLSFLLSFLTFRLLLTLQDPAPVSLPHESFWGNHEGRQPRDLCQLRGGHLPDASS